MNISNRTLFIADNLGILRGIDSECIDLIYLDPPFNTKKEYKAPIGSAAEGASFKDIWTDKDIENHWHGEVAETNEELYQIVKASEFIFDKSMKIYLMAMAVRLFEMHRILKPTGSIYLHCDPTASHYLKLVMDSLFGKQNFRNEIVWQRTNAHNLKAKYYSKTHDVLLFYAKDKDYTWNKQYTDYSQAQLSRYKKDETGRLYTGRDLTVSSAGGNRNFQWRGSRPPSNRSWGASLEQLERWYTEGRILLKRDGTPRLDGLKVYLDELPGKQIPAIWMDIPRIGNTSKERLGYPTQKPLGLLDRIIKASSNEGDMVLDPFCGCATACVAAERLNRQWIGIDISPSAEVITKIRLEEASEQGFLFSPIQMSDVTVATTPPTRTDTAETAVQRRLPSAHMHKNELYGKQEGHCYGCKQHFRIRNLTIDHVVPQSKGGTDHIENLQLLCAACNSTKGDGTQEDLLDRLREQHRELMKKLKVTGVQHAA